MEPRNQTFVEEFILAGFSDNLPICVVFFAVLLLMYIFTVLGNIFVIITIIFSSKLHLPMYFFLCNLSFLDLCYSSSNLPKAMVDIFSRKRTISVMGCMVQMNTGLFLGGTESFLLAVMAYDRYVAICLPLYYNIVMSWTACRNITIIMWLGSFLILTVPTNAQPMLFCGNNKLDHFVCELLALFDLACGDLTYHKLMRLVVSFFTLVVTLLFIFISYILIISSILRIQSTDGRSKAFSTCASHLTIVSMYYGTVITMYIWPTKMFASDLKYISLIYGIVTPGLNPLIYSMRNKDFKEAFHRMLSKSFLHKQPCMVFLN